MEAKRERTVYIDYLRVFATFAVIMLHVSATNWYSTDVNELTWQTFNFYDSIVRWAVPVFVMISGALFLNREISIKKIYSKNIFRLLCAFAAWSTVYALIEGGDERRIIESAIRGHYHMWFILMMIGLYICIPVLKSIVEKKEVAQYYLAVSFVFAFAIPEIVIISEDFGSELLVKAIGVINSDVTTMSMSLVLGYSSYFVLGYCLNQREFHKKERYFVYFLGLVGFMITIAVDAIVAIKTQNACDRYYGDFTVNVLFESIAVFVAFKCSLFTNKRLNNIAQTLAKYSFGAYLAHPAVIEVLNKRLGLHTLSFNPILSVLVISVVVFIISFIISAVMNHFPIVQKYFV